MSDKILHSLSWDIFGKLSKQFAGFVISILLARLLGPKEFGLVGLSMAFISTLSFFISTGLFSALIQKEHLTEEHNSSVFFFNLCVACILTLSMFWLAPVITEYLKTEVLFVEVIRALSLIFLISAFTQVQEALIRREMRFKLLSGATLLSTIGGGLVGVVLAINDFGVWSLVAYTLAERGIKTLYIWVKSKWRPQLVFDWNAIRDLWGFGFHMFITGLVDNLVNQIDSVIISRSFSVTDLGLYSRAKTLNRFVIRYSSESIGSVMFPALSRLQSVKQDLIEKGLKTDRIVAFVSFTLLGLLYITAEDLILVVLGQKWVESIAIYKLLCLSGFSFPMISSISSTLKAMGNSRLFIKLEFTRKSIVVLGLIVGFSFGLNEYLISLIITGTINVLLTYIITCKSFKVGYVRHLFDVLIYGVIAIISVLIISNIPFGNIDNRVLKILLLSLCYLSIGFLINTLLNTYSYTLVRKKIFEK